MSSQGSFWLTSQCKEILWVMLCSWRDRVLWQPFFPISGPKTSISCWNKTLHMQALCIDQTSQLSLFIWSILKVSLSYPQISLWKGYLRLEMLNRIIHDLYPAIQIHIMDENDGGFGADILRYRKCRQLLSSRKWTDTHIEISSSMLFTPKSCIMGWSRAYLTVGQANLTVKRGCSHCKQCREVERSGIPVYGWKMPKLQWGALQIKQNLMSKINVADIMMNTLQDCFCCRFIEILCQW